MTTANDGAEALERVGREDFDVIFLDIQMPIMDGYETVQALRANGYPKPILALTAHAMSEELQKSKSAGFDDYMTKPIELSHLIAKVRHHAKRNPAPSSNNLEANSMI